MPNIEKLLHILHLTPLSSVREQNVQINDYLTLLHRPKSYALFSATIVARGASVSCLARPVTRNSAPTTKASILPLEMSKIIGSHVHLVCNDLRIIAYTFSGVGIISIFSLCCNVVCLCYNAVFQTEFTSSSMISYGGMTV